MLVGMKGLKQKVEYTLKTHEVARNCDNSLVAFFLLDWYSDFYTDTFFDMTKFKYVPNVYDIIRYRKKIQNEDGNYKPTDPKVIKKRFNKQVKIRKDFGYNPEFAYPN